MGERTCPGCGAVIVPGPRERNKKIWCHQNCRQRWWREHCRDEYRAIADRRREKYHAEREASRGCCSICGEKLPAGKRRYCGSAACLRAANAAGERERYAANPEAGRSRVQAMRDAWPPERVEAERERAREISRANGYTETKRAAYTRRRARKKNVPVESFTHEEIFDRDGWRCGICGKRIDRSLRYPAPMSASLDHIVPLSEGGEHSRANTRASHLSCNVRRNVGRGEAEQLALV